MQAMRREYLRLGSEPTRGGPMVARWPLLILLFLAAFLSARVCHSDASDSLKGLRGFYVSSLQSLGLSKAAELRANPDALRKVEDKARSDMERVVQVELRKAGIQVFTEAEFIDNPLVPSLELSEITILDEYGTMHTAISLAVRQLVTIRVSQRSALATTWSRDRLVILGKDTAQRTRGTVATVNEMLEELVNDFLKANPKPSESK